MLTKLCTKCETTLPVERFSARSSSKDGLQTHCKACKAEYQRVSSSRAAVAAKYRAKHREQCVARSVASHRKKPEYYAEKSLLWVRENRERVLSLRRAGYAKNRGRELARCRQRAGRIRQNLSTLSPAHVVEIQGLYDFCSIFPQYEVDHIVPLNGKTVCGLHVPWNMQVLPISENRKKGNKLTQSESHLSCIRSEPWQCSR